MHSAVKVAAYIISEGNKKSIKDLTPLKVMKLTYLAHGWMLGIFDKPLVSEDVEAWEYGPVIRSLYRETKEYGRNPIPSLDYKIDKLSGDEKNIMEQIIDGYGDTSGSRLVEITHANKTPWYEATNGGEDVHPGIFISNEKIKQYYRGLLDE